MRIKYIEDNLVFAASGEVYAYYEMEEYNNAFISGGKRLQLSDDFQLFIGQCNAPDFHLLQIAAESDLKVTQEQAKAEVRGPLKDFAGELLDAQTEALIEYYGERQVRYRHYIGFRLVLSQDGLSLKSILKDIKADVVDFIGSVNHTLMNDYLRMDRTEVERYKAMERMLYNKLTRSFGFRKVTPDDYGYLIEHIHGMQGTSYEDYRFNVTSSGDGIRSYDYLKLTDVLIREKPRCLEIERDEGTVYAAYYAVSTIISELEFPNSQVLYHQQSGLSFPVDTSLRVRIVGNREAIRDAENVKKETDDLINNALNNDMSPSEDVLDANDSANDLKADLKRTRENMYRVSFLIRVWADTPEELEKRCMELKDFYDSYDFKLVRPFGNMRELHDEFLPAGKCVLTDYLQPVRSDFLSMLGFGATTKLGDGYGIYFGENRQSGEPVYLRPWLAAREKTDTKTNSLSALFSGATGWGKSVSVNLLVYYTAVFGGRVLILDPKSERGGWAASFPELENEIQLINLTSDEANRGMLDPFLVCDNAEDGKNLAMDILMYLTGISDADAVRFPLLSKAVRAVAASESPGLLKVIDELEKGDAAAKNIAEHIGGFCDNSFAKLMFSDGTVKQRDFYLDKAINILQVADLNLPDQQKPLSEYVSSEKLSVAAMLIIGNYGLRFISSDRNTFKIFVMDEAWALLGTGQGKSLQNKSVRMGRAMNSGIYFISQSVSDVGDAEMKDNLGMKFAFHSENDGEIRRILKFFGMDEDSEELKAVIRSLKIGECLFMDIWGHVGIVHVDLIFDELYAAFDTTPGDGDAG